MTAMEAMLPMLLEAERAARGLSQADLLGRLHACPPRCPARRTRFDALLQAARLLPPPVPYLPADAWPALHRATADLRSAGAHACIPAGPILLVRESRAFDPDLRSPQEPMLGGLLAGLAELGREGWLLRLPRRNARLLKALLNRLPRRPAAIISVDLAQPACLEALEQIAPVVKLALQSTFNRQSRLVAHDTATEAAEIAALGLAWQADQVAFVGLLLRVAGRRHLSAADSRLLTLLAVEMQNRHISLPSQLQFWVDDSRSLQDAGLLPHLVPQLRPHTLVVVTGPQHAAETAAGLATRPHAGLLCRHWSAATVVEGIPILGADIDLLAAATLVRLMDAAALAPQAAVLVPPKWHRPPRQV